MNVAEHPEGDVRKPAGAVLGNREIYRFFVSVLIWLPMMYFAWYALTPLLVWVLAQIGAPVLELVLPDSVQGLQYRGRELLVVSSFPSVTGRSAFAGVTHSPLQQGYGLPLYMALTLAVPSISGRQLLLRLGAGLVAVWAVQLWGLVFGVMDQLTLRGGFRLPELEILGAMADSIIHSGVALGVLIWPALIPVVLWALLNREFVENLTRRWRSQPT